MPEKASKRLGRKIKLLRKEAGLTQPQLGEKLGVSYQQIQKYERGVNRLAVDSLVRLCLALNVPVTVFLESDPVFASKGSLLKEPSPWEAPGYGQLSKEEKELLKGFRELGNEKLRVALLTLTRAAAGKKASAPKKSK